MKQIKGLKEKIKEEVARIRATGGITQKDKNKLEDMIRDYFKRNNL